ncbi:hypothetical protein AOR01nite_05320 [Acetobacter orleanensis]|uniref:Uncharacterized protein n=1 Tax=Acetobacter orleanensis TaxID=104099 RepID=A0A4Y3TMK5_9PROT|nr:hypothetical protein Abol_014_074 [Acetobacter orleanensis JCM 7639]GEB82055.1 hypothetical protein AOR01nite_05320 [Acetobacter orleanensis]
MPEINGLEEQTVSFVCAGPLATTSFLHPEMLRRGMKKYFYLSLLNTLFRSSNLVETVLYAEPAGETLL